MSRAKGGAPPPALERLRAGNEARHRAALERGSPHALATERRRTQAAARAAQTKPPQPARAEAATPPPDAARPAARRASGPNPDYVALTTGPARLGLAGIGRVLWEDGIEGLVRLLRSKS